MQLIDQRTKKIMEECKVRAKDAGLSFEDETLEYVVTNRDMIELSPKNMIPTMYDYWVHDLQAFKEKKIYELYPHNPFETVVNTRPAISFYNDNNPDWLNVMIFYHVLAHIDFFQNNVLFQHTWNDDFAGIALADKRLIAKMRSEKGRWVDYIIEFTRSIDNLVGYYDTLADLYKVRDTSLSNRVNFYFDIFLTKIKKLKPNEYLKEIETYNAQKKKNSEEGETAFFAEVEKRYPEFEAMFLKEIEEKNFAKNDQRDIVAYIMENSEFLNNKENEWMKSIMEIIRRTSLYFEPQRRTKIMNEGWASYWHERLFLMDERIKGHEVDFARVNSQVMPLPRAGLNPYALGWRLFMYIEDLEDKGKLSYEYEKIRDIETRKQYDKHTGKGHEYIFKIREDYNDFTFINDFIDQDFVDTHKLFVVGRRINPNKGVWEYYVKSRKAEMYKQMVIDSLYHPPYITIEEAKTTAKRLYLNHHFEGKPLVKEYIPNTLLGMEYLFGGEIQLETSEVDEQSLKALGDKIMSGEEFTPQYKRVVYTMKDRKISVKNL